MTADAIAARLERLCLALPGAERDDERLGLTYRVGGKIFAMSRREGARPAAWVKAPPGAQEVLLVADPERFFRPPYVGPKGWVGVLLDRDVDWDEVDRLVRRSFGLIAPKRIAALLES